MKHADRTMSSSDLVTTLPGSQPALLQTKLYVPRVHAQIVLRSRLLDLLDNVMHVALTVITAPTGFGKTTTVVQWLRQKNHPVAWVSLDASDNEPATFVRYLVAALQMVERGVGQATLALLDARQPPCTEALLTPLLNDLALLSQQVVVVLDDYHVVHATAVHNTLRFVLEHLPPHLHLVITSREDLPLPLTRLRVRRQLVEIGTADLRFTTDEATTFLHDNMQLPISATEVAALEQRTEGWIAGLQLAALAIQERRDVHNFVEAFTASNRFVMDYLVEEVVERLPPHLHEFLLQTSILDRWCAPLCDALVLGDAADPYDSYSRLLIEQLLRMNLFVIPLDNERRWYRYHQLFVEVLRERLSTGTTQNSLNGLHRRASVWFEQHHQIGDAIKHSLASGDAVRAAVMIEDRAEILFTRTEDALVVQWIGLLPKGIVQTRPKLLLALAFHHLTSGNLDLIEPLLEATQRLNTQSGYRRLVEVDGFEDQNGGWLDDISGITNLIRLTLMRARGDHAAVVKQGRATVSTTPALHPMIRGWTLWNIGMAYWSLGHLDVAGDYFRYYFMFSQEREQRGFVTVSSNMGQVYVEQGRLNAAVQHIRQILHQIQQQDQTHMPLLGMLYVMLGDILREQNDLRGATESVTDGIRFIERFTSGPLLANAYIVLARIRLAQGETELADVAFAKMRELSPSLDSQHIMRLTVTAHVVRFYLTQGQVERALNWVHEHGLLPDHPQATLFEQIAHARLLLAQQAYVTASTHIYRLLLTLGRSGRNGILIELLALYALASKGAGNLDLAIRSLKRALMLAEPHAYIRIFVEEGTPMLALLQEASARNITPKYVMRLLAAFDNVPVPVVAARPVAAAAAALLEPLNERELEILRLFATARTNQQIADKLMVARSTVKWHINNLYGKLGVDGRAAALSRAQELGLL